MPFSPPPKQLLEKYNIHPNKVLGQNFLVEKKYIDDLVDTAEVGEEDIIVEVGPGTGEITKELAKRAEQVIAVEKDPALVRLLKNELAGYHNIDIKKGDILKWQPAQDHNDNNNDYDRKELWSSSNSHYSSWKLVGAPPYYLTTRLFRHFLEEVEIKPQQIALIIQKEVAEKIVVRPPEMNLLAVSVQVYGEPKIVETAPAHAFWPRPDVDSAILTIKNIRPSIMDHIEGPNIESEKFFKLVRAGFSSPRKKLSNNLHLSPEQFKKADIDPSRRPQTLSVKEWKMLALQAFSTHDDNNHNNDR